MLKNILKTLLRIFAFICIIFAGWIFFFEFPQYDYGDEKGMLFMIGSLAFSIGVGIFFSTSWWNEGNSDRVYFTPKGK